MLRDEADAAHAGLLEQLAPRGLLRLLALVHAALRHLPPLAGALGRAALVGALPDEGESFAG